VAALIAEEVLSGSQIATVGRAVKLPGQGFGIRSDITTCYATKLSQKKRMPLTQAAIVCK
jgi:hypothetical protein